MAYRVLITAAFFMMLLCPVCSGADAAHEMTYTQAVVLGITEGLTEYLPVSSTGHLYIAAQLMGLGDTQEAKITTDAYVIAIQIGAILAVLLLYPRRISSMVRGFLGRDKEGLRLGMNTLIAFLPAAVIGLSLVGMIKSHLFGIMPVIMAWLAGGIAILIVAGRMRRKHEEGVGLEALSMKNALVIGLIQCIAMWPGVSRSLVTILGGAFVGLSVQASVEFSFLLGLVTLGAATCYEIVQCGPEIISRFGLVSPAIGIAVAFVSAVAAVKWMVAYLNTHGLEIFGYYRIVIAFCALGLVAAGLL